MSHINLLNDVRYILLGEKGKEKEISLEASEWTTQLRFYDFGQYKSSFSLSPLLSCCKASFIICQIVDSNKVKKGPK